MHELTRPTVSTGGDGAVRTAGNADFGHLPQIEHFVDLIVREDVFLFDEIADENVLFHRLLAQLGRFGVSDLWRDCRTRFGRGGDFLFGEFGNADAMFAPVVSRFRTYRVPLEEVAQAYADTVWAMPAMQEWAAAANNEPMIIAEAEF